MAHNQLKMKHSLKVLLLALSFFACKEPSYNITSIGHNEFLKYKVDENSFELGWFPESDTEKPLFRDYRVPDKEITPDPNIDSTSIFHPSNQPEKISLALVTDSVSVDNTKKLLSIHGKITRGSNSTLPKDLKVYIGKRQDTTVNVTFMTSPHIDNYYKGKKIDSDIDFEVPAFYLDDYQDFPMTQNPDTQEILLDITTLINDKSVLVVSQSNRYAEIFEIGKLLYRKIKGNRFHYY